MLTSYWITTPTSSWIPTPHRHASLGYGVAAYSLDDAIRIIHGWGFELPEDLGLLTVRENIMVAELDQLHVVPNMGPIIVRGLWHPFIELGVPPWMNIYLGNTR